jgi:hypothetical protein
MRVAGAGLMPLHSDPHGGKLPTVVPGPTQPTLFLGEDGFDPARHRLHGQAALCAPATTDGPIQDVDHLLVCRRLVTMLTRSGRGDIVLKMAVLVSDRGVVPVRRKWCHRRAPPRGSVYAMLPQGRRGAPGGGRRAYSKVAPHFTSLRLIGMFSTPWVPIVNVMAHCAGSVRPPR